MQTIGPLGDPFPNVARIAVLRGGGLGDLLMALPAIEALDHAYPDAEIVLLGAPAHAALLRDRPGPVDSVAPLPRAEGVHGLGGTDDAAVARFFAELGPVDLGVQVHGGGRWSNPFLLRAAPTWTVGSRTDDAAALTRWLPFRYFQHETMRALEVAGLAGAAPTMVQASLSVTERDLDAAAAALGPRERPLVAIHPGATDPRRRWPARRFGEVAATAAKTADVVVVGAADDAALGAEIVNAVPAAPRGRVVSVAGELSLPALVGVLASASVMVANDSGPRHIAQAVGTPTVSVYWMGNVINAGPPGRHDHRVHISWTAHCPVCQVSCTRQDIPRCPHDVSFVDEVTVDEIADDVLDLLDRAEELECA
ncbi:glycosyltransferase family 9 protein [Actinokineospora iranica]|uniref:glycosyltransferase family 9 protein n=1 Tax=Actinokineospora iranica TaxID=1271860 RepID=UPI001E5D20D5|nr:glycosyltransferase family 9 protein [Actinokineospora iranica]